MQQAELN